MPGTRRASTSKPRPTSGAPAGAGSASVREAVAEYRTAMRPRSFGPPRAEPFSNHGERVAVGQRLMQASSDIFLGWLHVPSGIDGRPRDFYARQLRDWKGSAEIEQMVPKGLSVYGRICDWTLARAHARSGDRIAIAAYLGAGDAFDRALVEFAMGYAQQNERDHAAGRAVDSGDHRAAGGLSGAAAAWVARRPAAALRQDARVGDETWTARLEAIGALLRERRQARGLSLRELARRTGVSNAYLGQLERGRHEPSLGVLRAVTGALGLSLGAVLAAAGVLEDGEAAAAPGTEAAILRDPELTEPQRLALLSVYRSFMAARLP